MGDESCLQHVANRTETGAEPAIVVEELDVRYEVYQEQRLSLKELTTRGFRKRQSTEVHAVRSVSFEIAVGEAVGIVGSNGSGKSTLLRALAGLQTPSAGRVLVRSQPRLLGVRAALQPQLSGYRNIVLGSLAMGIPMTEIDSLIDDVIDFAELSDAIDRPLRTYSSGMRARLAFGIATLLSPEIMLIDEALAVGDRRFRNKSLRRIRDIRAQAGTVVMVTHNVSEIRRTCSRAIWLENGALVMDGAADEVLEAYSQADPED